MLLKVHLDTYILSIPENLKMQIILGNTNKQVPKSVTYIILRLVPMTVQTLRCHPDCSMQYVKAPLPPTKGTFNSHPGPGVGRVKPFMGWNRGSQIRGHQVGFACVAAVTKNNPIVNRVELILNCLSNAWHTKHMTVVCTSGPSGNDVGESAYKRKYKFQCQTK